MTDCGNCTGACEEAYDPDETHQLGSCWDASLEMFGSTRRTSELLRVPSSRQVSSVIGILLKDSTWQEAAKDTAQHRVHRVDATDFIHLPKLAGVTAVQLDITG